MNGTILNLVMATLSIGLVIVISKKNKLSYKSDLGLVFPDWKNMVFWISLFVLLIVLEGYVYKWFRDGITESWAGKYTMPQQILRGIGIVILAPISEELIFRGLLYWRIKNTQLKYIGAIIIPAILFSVLHIQYSEFLTLGIIFVDGIFYGLARHFSRSVILTMLLHALSNLGAVLERVF